MKSRPIIFKGRMAQAAHTGIKTQIRLPFPDSFKGTLEAVLLDNQVNAIALLEPKK